MRVKAILLTVFLLCGLFIVVIPQVQCTFTYGNWSWDAATLTLTIIANATNNEGNTEGNAYDCEDVVTSGVVPASYYNVSASGTQYEFAFKIVQGDGTSANTTWFVDANKQITFTDNVLTASFQIFWELKGYAYAIFGTLASESAQTTVQGVSFIDLETTYNHYLFYPATSNTQLNLYSCQLTSTRYTIVQSNNARIWNNILTENVFVSAALTLDVFNSIISQSTYGIAYARGTIDRVSIYESTYALFFTFTATAQNVYARENTYLFRTNNLADDVYLIDVDSDTWASVWAGTNTGAVYRQYTFTINVTDTDGVPIENANVTLVDNDGTQEFSVLTGTNGSFAEHAVTYGFYNQTGGDTAYLKTPHRLTITHTDYATLDYTVRIDEWKTVTQVVLEARQSPLAEMGIPLIFGACIFGVMGLLLLVVVVKRRR